MAITIKAIHNESGKQFDFSKSDWYNYSQTGLYTYVKTIVTEDEPVSRGTSFEPVKPVTKSGCGCGK